MSETFHCVDLLGSDFLGEAALDPKESSHAQ